MATGTPTRGSVMDTLSSVFGKYSGHDDRGDSDSDRDSPTRSSPTSHHGSYTVFRSSSISREVTSRESELARSRMIREAEEKDKELAQTQAARRERERSVVAEKIARDKSNEEMQDRLRFTEIQMVNLKDENARLKRSYQESLTNLGEALKMLEEKAGAEREMAVQTTEMQAKIDELESAKEAILSRSMLNLRTYEEESLAKEREMATVSSRSDALQDSLEQIRTERLELLHRLQTLEAEKTSSQERLESERVRLAHMQKETELDRERSLSDLKAQVQHLRADNARLVRLLCTTSEYSAFTKFAFPPDSRADSGRVHSSYLAPVDSMSAEGFDSYLGGPAADETSFDGPDILEGSEPDTARWEDLEAYSRHYRLDDSQAVEASGEPELWVPTDVVRLTNDFRKKHLRHVPLEMIRGFLLELNAVWRRRFNKQSARIKERYSAQIKELKRQLNQRAPYKEVVQASEIGRLARDVHTLRARNLRGRPRSRSTSRSRRSSASLMDKSGTEWCSRMKVVNVMSPETRGSSMLIEKNLAEVENLRRRLAESGARNHELERSLRHLEDSSISKVTATSTSMTAFNRGMSWFGKRIVGLADKLGESVTQNTDQLQRYCSSLAGTTEPSLSDVRKQITAIASIQREVTQYRTAARQTFEKALAAGQSASKFERLLTDEHSLTTTTASASSKAKSSRNTAWLHKSGPVVAGLDASGYSLLDDTFASTQRPGMHTLHRAAEASFTSSP